MQFCNQNQSFRPIRPILCFRIIFCAIFLLLSAAGIGHTEQILYTQGSGADSLESNSLESKIEAIQIHWIRDGKERQTLVSRQEIRQKEYILPVKGYVVGLVAFCDADVTVQMEDHPMSRIRINRDGTYSARYYGLLDPEGIPRKVRENGYFDSETPQEQTENRKEVFLKGSYSYFPKVTGDQVWPRKNFRLRFTSGQKNKEVEIYQEYGGLTPLGAHKETDFFYLGTRLNQQKARIQDFDARLVRIADGIAQVNGIFRTDLIHRVVIIDYDGIKNAITREESDDIWFYIRTFIDEPPDELATIAAHETLHKYVDLRRLTKDRDIRTLFADLKGFSLFTKERFLLVTEGILIEDATGANPEGALFFDFINEKNFLENRKGGHADENLDEFCTSFIHSLIHIDRLEANLKRPIRTSGGFPYIEQSLTPAEAASVAREYQKILEAIRKEMEEIASAGLDREFLDQRLEVSYRVRQGFDDAGGN